jgi:hypothetical protein
LEKISPPDDESANHACLDAFSSSWYSAYARRSIPRVTTSGR